MIHSLSYSFRKELLTEMLVVRLVSSIQSNSLSFWTCFECWKIKGNSLCSHSWVIITKFPFQNHPTMSYLIQNQLRNRHTRNVQGVSEKPEKLREYKCFLDNKKFKLLNCVSKVLKSYHFEKKLCYEQIIFTTERVFRWWWYCPFLYYCTIK